MRKIDIKVFIGLALLINIFSYLGLRSIQWVWMSQNNFINSYLPYLGFSSIDLGSFIYLTLPDFIPILLLVLALALAGQKKIVVLLASAAFLLRILAFFLSIPYTMFWGPQEWPLGISISRAVRSQILGFSDFTLLLDIFSMLVTIGSQISLVLLSILVIKRIKSERLSQLGVQNI